MTFTISKQQTFIISDGDDGNPGGPSPKPIPDDARFAAFPEGGFAAVWAIEGTSSDAGVMLATFNAQGEQQLKTVQITDEPVADGALPDVAVLRDGAMAIVWNAEDGDQIGTFGVVYSRNGTERGPIRLLNQEQASDQAMAAVTELASGGFQAVWASSGQDGAQDEIYARQFDAKGRPKDDEFRVNKDISLFQTAPDTVTLPETGDLVTAYTDTSDGVFVRVELGGDPIPISQDLVRSVSAELTALPGNGFAVSFSGLAATDSFDGTFAVDPIIGVQPIQRDGSFGERYLVRSLDGNTAEDISVVGFLDGGFAAAWELKVFDEDRVHTASEIYIARVDANGVPVGEPTQVPTARGTPFNENPALIDLGGGTVGLTYQARARTEGSPKEEGMKFVSLFTGAIGTQDADRLEDLDGTNVLDGRAGNDIVRGLKGADKINGGIGRDTLEGGRGEDTILGETGADWISGGGGRDEIKGGDGPDTISGGIGRDWVVGGPDADVINGGGSVDRVEGGTGDDLVTGGGGRDRFVFSLGDGNDTITDYSKRRDEIELDSALWEGEMTAFDVLKAFTIRDGEDLLIDFGAGDSLRLVGVGGLLSTLAEDVVIV